MALALVVGGCTPMRSGPVTDRPLQPVTETSDGPSENNRDTNLSERNPLHVLNELSLRDLVADGEGQRFIVQDQKMALYLVDADGKTHLGEAPGIQLLAAWDMNDHGYAFARKSATGKGYEIVRVGHAGSQVLAQAVGDPGAIQFVGQEVHFIDAEGWKAVPLSGGAVLKAPLALGPRGNQKAWCAWPRTGPVCLGGYWNGAPGSETSLTIVRAGEWTDVMAKGDYHILGSGAVSKDGRLVAASLGARSAGATSLGKVVVSWLDENGTPVRTKAFALLARELAFDAYGRLVVHAYPPDGSGPGIIAFLDLDDGSTSLVSEESGQGHFAFTMEPSQKKLYLLPADGGMREVSLAAP